jgi:arylformamidase
MTLPNDLRGTAVLIRFGWDEHWGSATYDTYPYIGDDVIAALKSRGAKLLGVDTPNVDTRLKAHRPAHSVLLADDILIVENLMGLGLLPKADFRFFAVPP